jgi:hypothetical protein
MMDQQNKWGIYKRKHFGLIFMPKIIIFKMM